ncbi:helix-turn-helix domain-containing protein [Acetobacter persici]|nr:helix-turn-helix domain-containing protein [Acetobacter persici]
MMTDAVKRAIEAAGGVAVLAQQLGIKAPSIYSWRAIPPKRVRAIARITGIPAAELRPDMFGNDEEDEAA